MSNAPVGSPAVLIVDDHIDTREMLSFVFEEAGFTVCGAGCVMQALECLRDAAHLPALILSDIVMPGVSGTDFIRYLSGSAALRHIPVIVVTGANPAEAPAEARVVIQKPADPYALVKLARQIVYGERAVRSPAHQAPAAGTASGTREAAQR